MKRARGGVLLAVTCVASGALAVSALVDGCALPSFTLGQQEKQTVDAGFDAPPDVMTMPMPEAGPPACTRATYPDPPGGVDDGTSVGPLVFAIRSVDLGDEGTTPGYDLDYTCTCFEDAGGSCVGASPQLSTYCDGTGGIDNQATRLFSLLETLVGSSVFGSSVFSAQANAGRWSLLVQVTGYNGKPDDPEVQVALFPSAGTVAAPQWMGADEWRIASSAVGDGGVGTPIFVADGAYVSGGTLVASLPTGVLTIQGGGLDVISIRISAGFLTGNLLNTSAWTLQNGVFAGRWALPDVFSSIGTFRDNNGKPICTNDTGYSIAKDAICTDADILVDDTLPKTTHCNAISLAFGFNAQLALLGPISDAGAATDGCAPANDPTTDSCP